MKSIINNGNYWLEEFDALSIQGKDSLRFLNGLTTSNMNLQNEVVQTCWLTPKGALRAILEIYFHQDHLVLIALEGNLFHELKQHQILQANILHYPLLNSSI